MKPYIYKIIKKDTGEFYIGSQCKGLEIGKNYFTSIKAKDTLWFKEEFKANTSSFEIEIVKIFEDPLECVKEENELIKENFDNPLNINRSYHTGEHIFTTVKYKSREERLQAKREYYNSNKELISSKKKELYNSNKEEINKRRREQYKELTEEAKQKISDYKKSYYETNKEAINQKNKDYYEAHKQTELENKKKYYQDNKDCITQKNKEYYEAHRETIILQQKEYKEKHREYYMKKSKEYYEAHKESSKERKRRAKKMLKIIKQDPELYEKYKTLPQREKEKFRDKLSNIMEKKHDIK